MLIRLHGCAGWSAPLLFTYGKNRFSHDTAHISAYPIQWICRYEPLHDKTNKMACAPSKDSDQPGHLPSLIRDFAVRMKKAWVLNCPLSAQRRLIRLGGCPDWSETLLGWVDAQAYLSLCCVHSHFVGFVMRQLISFHPSPSSPHTNLFHIENCLSIKCQCLCIIWAPSSEFVSSSIPSWQILTAHAQPFREARDLAFCLKVPLDSLLVWASSEGSGETARMRRLARTFAARIGDKYQISLTRSICYILKISKK